MATLEELNKKLLEIESNNQNTNIEELNKILAEEDKEEDFVSAEEAGIKINPSELLSKDADKDLVDQIKEKNKDIKKELPKPGSAEELNARLEVMEGSILDGGTLEPDIEEIIEKEGYYSWENFSENLIKRTFVGAARDTLQGSIDFTNYIGNKFFDERPFENVKLPKIAEPTYFGGSFSRDITGFAIPFLGITKAANSLNLITKIPKATTKAGAITQFVSKNAVIGGLAEQFAFSPYETRLSNLVESFPTLANPITEYLQANPQYLY